jgi:hypothetical protein
MSLIRFKGLPAEKRALVAFAVLLDGREAITYLGFDAILGNSLQRTVEELSDLEPELRMPLAGTLLREAIAELENSSLGNR